MPSLGAHLNQKAVLWAKTGTDNYGNPTVSAAKEIPVRWIEDEGEMLDAEGDRIRFDVKLVVDRVLVIGSIVRQGTKASLPSPPDSLYQVVGFREVPNIKGDDIRRTAMLIRYSNTLPTIGS